ncbi:MULTISPECIES: helix-turn-helix transcriptional regulator [Rhizobium/Agrobacterium group]|uniref:Helix-turn-helix protein n=1 Tax=Rhizobium subbaraonis TaxID=908946 RepID=A0A285UYB9_9HYPH|nr:MULTISPECIES: helix-turn-helix transcriptional regulator [Rhizobium/Agrobacterium group]WLS06913.1 helix-turn-helix transcriptional regulator [Shinella sumterensis]MDH0871658.1 helix-turn-helix transcriptional regulator [Agrobacterium pusense]TQN62470.1 helix-turn-helix domain-containing protein [Agrobacterium tumefaciens]CDN94505.1 Helix-turn-helix domain-containing protein [Agrobacterium tumefaciens]SOC46884.1 helix-turn-helix protein [Rhizobium subbaraonis]
MRALDRTRSELAGFLRTRRERLTPEDAGLPGGRRRRTPGLRREEVAALAGVGVTWYTWLEQGREIGVSADFLDNLARVLKLDAAERRHLFLLAHERPPAEPGKTFCTVPSLAGRLVDDLAPHAAYIINLRWDVLTFNPSADCLFGFGRHVSGRCNLLWLLFTDPALRDAFVNWETQAPAMLASFRRDFAAARDDADAKGLIAELEAASPEFKGWWRDQDVHAPCTGTLTIRVEGQPVEFEHTSLTVDGGQHLRLVVYARVDGSEDAS